MLLAGGDQQQRAAHLNDREKQDRRDVGAKAAKRAAVGGKRQQHQRGKGRAHADDHGRGHVVVESELD